jgi:transposase
MRHLILNDPQSVRRSIRSAVKGSRDQRLLHELHCVLLVGLGRSCQEVGEWFGDSTRTVERWVGAFNRQGVAGLGVRVPCGRRPRLSSDTVLRLRFELRQSPRICGFPDAAWGGRLLMHHLQEHYGVTLGLRQCQRTLRRLRALNPMSSRT